MRSISRSPAPSSSIPKPMRSDRSQGRYTLIAIVLHWAMALGIAVLVVLGLVMAHLKLGPMRLFQLYQLHKSIGITVLLAAVLRRAGRLIHHPPALPASMPPLERKAASTGHALLYGFLFVLPLI